MSRWTARKNWSNITSRNIDSRIQDNVEERTDVYTNWLFSVRVEWFYTASWTCILFIVFFVIVDDDVDVDVVGATAVSAVVGLSPLFSI